MNLEENVSKIKTKIFESYHKRLTRLGVGKEKLVERDPENEDYKKAKATIEALIEDKDNYQDSRNEYLEEVSFTLFNRVAGIKVMESKNRKLIPEAIKTRSNYGEKSFSHNAWLEENTNYNQEDLEGIEVFIRYKFDELSMEIPLYDSANLFDLLPEKHDLVDILSMFNEEINDDEWEQDDILGWLYESYNKKEYKGFKESGDKIEWDKVSLSSQMYTPRWVVEFLVNNSLGKYWLEINPNSKIKLKHDIANPPEESINNKTIEEIKIIDPASGSGNFLLYSFDLLCEIYEEEGYSKEDIPRLILENNLYGLDIDERAVQIARLQLYIKAKTYNRSSKINNMNIVSANFHLPEFIDIKEQFNLNIDFNDDERKFLAKLWEELRSAHKFGSLLKLDEVVDNYKSILINNETNYPLMNEFKSEETLEIDVIEKLKNVLSKIDNKNYSLSFLKNQSLDALNFTEILLGVKKEGRDYLVSKYDVALSNPPYTDSADYGEELKIFIKDNYKKPISFYKNLYASFIKKNVVLVNDKGKIAMITSGYFTHIKSYEDLRKFIVDNLNIELFVDWGYLGIFNEDTRVDSSLYVLEKNKNKKESSCFIKLNDLYEGLRKKYFKIAYSSIINRKKFDRNYSLNINSFKYIDGYPFIYWISDSFREKFKNEIVDKVLNVKQGLATGNNFRFLRYWWEVDKNDISNNYLNDNRKWIPYQKGGDHKKWYGNNWLLVNWEKDGFEIKNFYNDSGKLRSRPQNQEYYFKEGITYNLVSAKVSMRYMPPNNIFDVGGSAIFLDYRFNNIFYFLGFFNSKVINYIIGCLNQSVNSQVGDLKRIPFVKPSSKIERKIEKLVKQNIKIKKEEYKFNIVEKEFENNPLLYKWGDTSLKIDERLNKYINFKYKFESIIIINEAIIDELIFHVFELTEQDIDMINKKEDISTGKYKVFEKDKSLFIKENKNKLEFEQIKFIENLEVERKINRNEIENYIKKLYLKNKSIKFIANEVKLNPISILQIIKEINDYPERLFYTISHELLLDTVRKILLEDNDGIVILNEYADEEPLDKRIINYLNKKNYKNYDLNKLQTILNQKINNYLKNKFLLDECDTLNLFIFQPKTPFIWHLSSGEEHGFDAFVIIYKWNRDKVFKLKSFYLDKRKTGLKNRMNSLSGDDSVKAEKEKDKIRKQLLEIDKFEEKLDELLKSGYDPKLDDGVGKNIAPLQNLGLLSYDVLTKGQLKKFLNADW